MPKSLIRKNQLHPDIGDLVTGYGSSIFSKSSDFNQLSGNLLDVVTLNKSITVLTTGNQTISGLKNFVIRPTINNTGILLQGEIPLNILYTTGTQTVTSAKNFTVRPTVNNTGVLLQGELPLDILYTTGTQTVTSAKNFTVRPTVNNTGVLLQGEEAKLPDGIFYTTGTQTVTSAKNFTVRPTVNNTGVLLQGEEAKLPDGILYTTGSQTVNSAKNFTVRPTFNNVGLSTLDDFKLNFIYVNSSQTVQKNTKIGVDTSVSSFNITLPTSNLSIGDVIEIIDLNKTFNIRNLTINGLIEDSSAGLICNVAGSHFNLIYVGGPIGWEISVIDNNFSTVGFLPAQESQFKPLLFLSINVPNGQTPQQAGLNFNSNNSQNYKIPWNSIDWYNPELVSISSNIDNSKLLTYNPDNKNIYIREQGLFNIDMRYASYDLITPDAFLRARLRSSSSPILGGLTENTPIPDGTPGVNILSAFAQGPIGTTSNGEAMVAGVSNIRFTSADIPIYIVADFLHTLAFGGQFGNQGFPVFDNTYGNRPFLLISKIADL